MNNTSTNNNIPEPELFTSKIEETIDDLFKPSKKIEIDPLTQEVKEIEVEEKENDLTIELALEPNNDGEQEINLKKDEPSEIPKYAQVHKEIEKTEEPKTVELEHDEFDLELELDEAEKEEETQAEKPLEITASTHPLLEHLQRLREKLYTIEWEAEPGELKEAIGIIDEIQKEFQLNHEVSELLLISKKVMEAIEKNPKEISPNAPSLLKIAIESIIEKETEGDTQRDILSIKEQVSSLLLENQVTKDVVHLESKETELEISNEKEEINKIEGTEAISEVHLKDNIPLENIEANYLSNEASELIKSHLDALSQQVKRIIPLEKVLAKKKGMEKLYGFQKGLRLALEEEIKKISDFFFPGEEIALPKIHYDSPSIPEEKKESIREKKADIPWKELYILSVDGVEIGIPIEEIGFFGKPPWLSKSFIKKSHIIPLSKLKPWPWSKLKGIFSERLAELSEDELKKLNATVVSKIGNQELPIPPDFYLLVLYDGQNCIALRVGDAPVNVKLSEELSLEKTNDTCFEGILNMNGTKVHIISAKSLSRS